MITHAPDDSSLLALVEFLRRRDCIVPVHPERLALDSSCLHLPVDDERRHLDELVAEWRSKEETGP